MSTAKQHKQSSPYIELVKPRILVMVLVTTVFGYILGCRGDFEWSHLIITLLGTGMASASAAVLNNVIERETDKLMDRTKHRALPEHRIGLVSAEAYAALLFIGSGVLLGWQINLLTAGLALGSAVLYAFVYTPMKKLSWLNTPFGAIPGALPPMIGWAAATGRLDIGAWVLFGILFLWQHPHFYAIAWMFREDYARGGFKMLPVVQPDGKSTFRQSLAACIILIPVSLWPTFVGITHWIYFFGTFVIGIWFLYACIRWRLSESTLDARKVLRVSVIYLPLLLLLIIVDLLVYGV